MAEGHSLQIWLNGRLVDADGATVSIFDAGLQHGVGLFETMLARGGRVIRGRAHLRRLADSARILQLTERLRTEPLGEAVQQTIDANDLQDARVRLTLTGGSLHQPSTPAASRGRVDPSVFIVAQPATIYPEAFFTDGVTVVVADGRVNPLDPMAGHKTLNYWGRISALAVAAARQAAESLWFTVSNHLAGGSVSNIFLVHEDELLTPIARGEEEHGALPAPVLPGITRGVVLEHATSAGLTVHKRQIDIEDLLAADEVFLTNSSWGVLPVVRVERETIGTGVVGPVARRMRGAVSGDGR